MTKTSPSTVQAIMDHYLPVAHFGAEGTTLQRTTLLALAHTAPDITTFLRQMPLGTYTDAGSIQSNDMNLLSFHAVQGLELPIVFMCRCPNRGLRSCNARAVIYNMSGVGFRSP